MADSDLEAPKAGLVQTLAEMTLEIEGMQHINNDPLSPELHLEIGNQIAYYTERQGLIKAAVDALTALLAHGYPDLKPAYLSPDLAKELTANVVQTKAGAEVFQLAPPPAVTIEVAVEPFTDTQPLPPRRK